MTSFHKITTFLAITILLFACKTQSNSSKVAYDVHTYPQEKISNTNLILGSYIFSENDIANLEKRRLSQKVIQDIVAYSNQSNWPLALQNILDGTKAKQTFALYNTFLIVSNMDESDVMIYAVPYEENKQMPDSLLLDKQDFYVIVKR